MTPAYDQFTVHEFVTDPAFIAWVKSPNAASDQFWQTWLQHHPAKEKDVQQARLLVLQFTAQADIVTQTELDEDWVTIQQRIQQPVTRPIPTVIKPLWQRQWAWTAAAAAAVLLVLGINYWSRLVAPAGTEPIAQRLPSLALVNRTKQVVAQRLPDGSVVWMTPGARLVHPRQFAADRRLVQFTGEGFFEVTKDAARPFIIESGQLKTQVLGTSFNVKAEAGSDRYAVSVVTGKVSVSAPLKDGAVKTVVLQPQQQALFALTTKQLAMTALPDSPAKHEAWQPVSLSFTDATLGDVARQLERAFDTDVILSSPALSNCRLTVDFQQQRLAEILEQINKLLNTQYTLDGNHVVLTGDGCQP